jgi:exodeoxyribonuclease VII small subunit
VSLLPPEPADSEPRAHAATYESATARIEEIIRRLDSGEAGLRETLELCREGRELVEFCAAELDAVGAGLEELKLDELASQPPADTVSPAAPRVPRRTRRDAGARSVVTRLVAALATISRVIAPRSGRFAANRAP